MSTSVNSSHFWGSQNVRVLLEFRMIREVLQPFSRYLPGSIPIPALELDVCSFDEFFWRAVRHIDLPLNIWEYKHIMSHYFTGAKSRVSAVTLSAESLGCLVGTPVSAQVLNIKKIIQIPDRPHNPSVDLLYQE